MNDRQRAVRAITEGAASRKRENQQERHLFDFFGNDVFNEQAQREYLSESVFKSLQKIIAMGAELYPGIADAVASGLQKWAMEKGATHFCHWFQPLTDLTAEKHDSMFVPGKEGSAIAEFNGKLLIRGEPDASSFPSGGLRTTFEARGYTAWDPSSPAVLLGRTLVIPTVFLSWTGDALDKKTPLLRSMEALNEQALRILALFGERRVKRVFPTAGAEQEFFLIDKHFLNMRPDLLICGRVLFGAKAAKGQELEDQYFGSIPAKILSIMVEAEYELMRLGVPIKTRHNEVAPSQYELANTYEPANIAGDHNMLVMEILRQVADRHGMATLFHEKPFDGINGSGKHNNWSLCTDTGKNLLAPGDSPQANAQFLLFCAAIVRAVHMHAGLLRLSIASQGNDHRLGQHEAPPAIISVFLGEQLFDIFDRLAKGENKKEEVSKKEGEMHLGVLMLPRLPRHTSDRNRTSPFAFTGDKFEFRAIGSSENIAPANTVLNTIVAESLDYFATQLEGKRGNFNERLQTLLAKVAREFFPVLFEGDNYSEAWRHEAKKRGLPNITNTVDAAKLYTSKQSVDLFAKYRVYTQRELASRQEILLSTYAKKVTIEAKTASNIAHTIIVPAVLSYVKELGDATVFLNSEDQDLLYEVVKEFSLLRKALRALDTILAELPQGLQEEQAVYLRDKILPAMNTLRSHADRLELIVSDACWPLPKYREMLFIH